MKTGTGGELLYVNPWYVAALGRNSKQVFAGATRIVTKLETFPTGEGYGNGARDLREAFQYFYHPDHLGSTAYATDASGEVYQHLEYFPFGESWVDEVNGSDRRVPYRFTGKEYDPETKLYYYGARYYDPRTSVWQNPDPALGRYLSAGKAKLASPSLATGWHSHLRGAGMGGAFEPRNIALYGYASNNPLNVVDPNGETSLADWLGRAALRDAAKGLRKRAIESMARKYVEKLKRAGIEEAWRQEKILVERTGRGTREWTESEIKELLSKGKVEGYAGHHINSVVGEVEGAASPNNIQFLQHGKGMEHQQLHSSYGGTRVPTQGELIDRSQILLRESGEMMPPPPSPLPKPENYFTPMTKLGIGVLTGVSEFMCETDVFCSREAY